MEFPRASPSGIPQTSLGFRGHLITNFQNIMVLVCNTMVNEDRPFELYEITWELIHQDWMNTALMIVGRKITLDMRILPDLM